jgi:nitrite reductase/ring-hydroxylating ferredoxin subunit
MQHDTQVALTEEVFAHLDAKTTARNDAITRNPVAVYADPDWLAREKRTLFRDYPLLMGLSCQLPDVGSYLTEDRAGVPIVVVRGEDGGVRAFMNVCRHRGAKVAEGCGRLKKNFVCPYHGWSFDTAGRLVGIPDRDSFKGLDQAQNSLVELPAEERDGLIWVRPSVGAPLDIEGHLAGLAPELASYGFESYHHYDTRILRQKMNWKIVIDTFLEPYHFGVLHAGTVGPIFFPNLCLFHPFGLNLRETLPRRSIVELRDMPKSEWDLVTHTALVYVLFPNTVFVMQADHAETWRVFPVGDSVDECMMYLDFYIPEPADTESARRHWDRNMDLTIRTVVEEDFPTGESIQFGFGSGVQDHVIFGRNEPALAHFENSIAAAVRQAAE